MNVFLDVQISPRLLDMSKCDHNSTISRHSLIRESSECGSNLLLPEVMCTRSEFMFTSCESSFVATIDKKYSK